MDVWTTCDAVAAQCTDVVPIASTFDDAYFEIRYITFFSKYVIYFLPFVDTEYAICQLNHAKLD